MSLHEPSALFSMPVNIKDRYIVVIRTGKSKIIPEICRWCAQLLQGQNIGKFVEDSKTGEKGRSQEEVLLFPQLCLPAVVALLLRLWLHQVCPCKAEAVCRDEAAAASSSDGELQPEPCLSIQGLNTLVTIGTSPSWNQLSFLAACSVCSPYYSWISSWSV